MFAARELVGRGRLGVSYNSSQETYGSGQWWGGVLAASVFSWFSRGLADGCSQLMYLVVCIPTWSRCFQLGYPVSTFWGLEKKTID